MTAGPASRPAKADPDFRHAMPQDLRAVLDADPALDTLWLGLTDLQRNEWICWMTSGKQEATRIKRRTRLAEDIRDGTRTPCCWPGCPHRREAARKWVDA